MNAVFYISAFIAVIATAAAITRTNPVHAILYFILSLFAVGIIFFVLGAPFVAALIIIINAGAIMVLFVFIVMMVNQGKHTIEQEILWTGRKSWFAPSFLATILLIEIIYLLTRSSGTVTGSVVIAPKEVGMSLFGPYVLGIELVSMILFVGLVGAYHLARKNPDADTTGEIKNYG